MIDIRNFTKFRINIIKFYLNFYKMSSKLILLHSLFIFINLEKE
jgi:hypothetical protein